MKETIFISEGGILDDFVVMVAYSSLGFTIFCENLNRALNSRLKACRKVAYDMKKLKELKIKDIVIISSKKRQVIVKKYAKIEDC